MPVKMELIGNTHTIAWHKVLNTKRGLKPMKKIKILTVGDMQNGFIQEDGNLYITGARDIIVPTNYFLSHVRDGVFDVILIILDTHFAEEYSLTEESKMFPIHCEYGTYDWELAVDVSGLQNTRFLTKNQFTMWGDNRLHDIPFNDPQRKTAYDNLFHIVDNPYNPTEIARRDDYLEVLCPDCDSSCIEVTMIGVASDYCNRYAMEGWLDRGAYVTIIQDLTKGIEKETPQIIDEYRPHHKDGRLRSVVSAEYLRELVYS